MSVRVYILLVSTDISFVVTFTVSGKKSKLRNCQVEKLGRNTVVIHTLRTKKPRKHVIWKLLLKLGS